MQFGHTNEAIDLFESLIKNDYYAFISFRKLLSILLINQDIRFKKYYSRFKEMYPNECDIFCLTNDTNELGIDSLFILAHPCLISQFQDDVIFGRLFLAKVYLFKGQFNLLDSMISAFEMESSSFIFSDKFILQRGLYYDLKLRSLFLQKKYSEFCVFARERLGYNRTVIIRREDEFKNYVFKLFTQYNKSNLDFDLFYSENFIW